MSELVRYVEEAAIRDVIHHYSYCLDARHVRQLPDVFAEDAVVDLGYGTWRGIEQVICEYERILGPFEATAHVVTNVRVDLQDQWRASSTAYVTAWHWLTDPSASDIRPADFMMLALYRDAWRRSDELGWRIQSRRARRLGPSALAVGDLPTYMRSIS
jgi:hypothetical protein